MIAQQELQCSVNYIGCKGKAKYVCHHCGRPLCDGPDCGKWGWDATFAGLPIAYHCPAHDHLPLIGRLVRGAINLSNKVYGHWSNKVYGHWSKIVTKITTFVRKVIRSLKQGLLRRRRKPIETKS